MPPRSAYQKILFSGSDVYADFYNLSRVREEDSVPEMELSDEGRDVRRMSLHSTIHS